MLLLLFPREVDLTNQGTNLEKSFTIHLSPNRIESLWEILDNIPSSHRRTSTKKWHEVLYEL